LEHQSKFLIEFWLIKGSPGRPKSLNKCLFLNIYRLLPFLNTTVTCVWVTIFGTSPAGCHFSTFVVFFSFEFSHSFCTVQTDLVMSCREDLGKQFVDLRLTLPICFVWWYSFGNHFGAVKTKNNFRSYANITLFGNHFGAV